MSIKFSPFKIAHFLSDRYIRFVLQTLWRKQGVVLGEKIVWLGKPILVLVPGSTISIGDRCLICSRSEQTVLGVNHPVILRTLCAGADLRIGAGVRMSGTTICAAERVVIGDRCVIGANVTIVDTDFHALDPIARSSQEDAQRAAHKPVVVGDDVFICAGSIVLKGVRIGKGAVIGTGSVVTKSIPDMTVAAGNPARVVRSIEYAREILA